MSINSNGTIQHNLLIIGNGFDLTLGLKSEFTTYLSTYNDGLNFLNKNLLPEAINAYKYYINSNNNDSEILVEINNVLINGLSAKLHDIQAKRFYQHMEDVIASDSVKKIDFWSIYLNLKKDEHIRDWSDVESQMYNFVTKIPKKSVSDLYQMVKFIYEALRLESQAEKEQNQGMRSGIMFLGGSGTPEQRLNDLVSTLNRDNHDSLSYKDVQKLLFYTWVLNYIYTTRPGTVCKGIKLNNVKSISDIKDMLLRFLKRQVLLFERHLDTYLISCVKRYTKRHDGISYYDAGEDLIYALTPNHYFSLLNFNYTNPLLKCNKSQYDFQRNIHGLLTPISNLHYQRTGPVIGIDDSGIKLHDAAYVFTKNYRIMRLSCNNYKDVLCQHVDQIEFFGHSFDFADRLYFFNIFDRYKIKDCKVRLVFYYIDYNGHTDDECAIDQIHKVNDLFDSYVKYHKKQGLKDYLDINMKDLVHILSMRGKLVIANIRDSIKPKSNLDKIIHMNNN